VFSVIGKQTKISDAMLQSHATTAPIGSVAAAGRLASVNPDTGAALLKSPARIRGGLRPRTLRRVCDYIEAHLEENISNPMLAAIAGLSIFHFVRAFKQSKGSSPHEYVIRRRVERSMELLAGTDLPLAEIAAAAGFSDQSHLARRFREHAGVSPRDYRWSMR